MNAEDYHQEWYMPTFGVNEDYGYVHEYGCDQLINGKRVHPLTEI